MTELKLNEAQRAAVAEFDRDLLVSAGAGTGKTRVLVEKFLRLITEGRATADQITAITFTNKAAAEMRERVRKGIRQRSLEAVSPSERQKWVEELVRFEAARIGTFHSFCLGLIHEYPLELGLPPVTGVIAEGEAYIYLNEACDQALAELLDAREIRGPEGLRALADMVVEEDWGRLRQNLIVLYQKVRESGRSFDELFQVTQAGLERELKRIIISPAELIDSVDELLRFSETQKLTDTARLVLDEFTAEWPYYREVISGNDGAAMLPVLLILQKRPSLRQNIFKDRIDGVREIVATLLQRLADQEAARRLPFVVEMLTAIDRHYRKAKREKGLLDFNDQQLYARELLRNHPKVTAALRREIHYLLVDEFQDTNSLQLELIQLLLGPEPENRRGRWMAVGDIKQSIYRFRGAEAGVIHNLEQEFRQSGRAVVPLTVNYRSNRVILDFANAVCAELFQNEPFDFISLQAEREDEGAPVEILLAEDEAAEARLLARRIGQLAAEGHSHSDMAMLFRTTTKMGLYQQALKEAGIPFYRTGGRGFYNSIEVRDQLNLLALVEQRNDSIALLALLTSPYVALGVESLFWLGRDEGLLPGFYKTNVCPVQVPADEWERLQAFRELLRKLQANREQMSIAQLLRSALAESDYPAVLWSQPHAGQRLANLEKLLAKAEEFATRGYHDLPRFRQYIEALEAAGAEEGEAPVENEAGDAVRLMTVHAAKGLEFPIVLLPNLNKSFRNNQGGRITYHNEMGLAFKLDVEGEKVESSAWAKLKELNRREELAERKRLLYVALTRAENRLLLSGVPNKDSAKDNIAEANNWLRWLELMLPLDEEGAVEWCGIPLQVIRKLPDPQPSSQKISLLQTHGPRLLAETGVQDTSVLFTAVKVHSEKPLRLNVSELLAFRSCGRRYFWKYRLCLTEPLLPQGNRPEKPAGLGVAIGDFFHRAVRAGGIEWPENLWDGFRREMGLDEASAPKLQGDLRRIWGHYQGSRFTGQGGECWQEVPFVVKLGEKLHIEGRLDRLLQTKDGKLILVDFKTHRHIANIVDTSEAYFWQLQLYALAIKALWGRLPDEAILYFLFSDTEVLVPLDENALNKTIAAIKENTALIGGGELLLDFPAATDCSGCGYQLFCNSSGGSSSS